MACSLKMGNDESMCSIQYGKKLMRKLTRS